VQQCLSCDISVLLQFIGIWYDPGFLIFNMLLSDHRNWLVSFAAHLSPEFWLSRRALGWLPASGRGPVLLKRHCEMWCTSGFVDYHWPTYHRPPLALWTHYTLLSDSPQRSQRAFALAPSHWDGRFCLIFANTAQRSVLDGTNELSSSKPCAACVLSDCAVRIETGSSFSHDYWCRKV